MPLSGQRHGVVCSNVIWLLGTYTFQRRRGYVLGNGAGIIWERNPDTVRGPDVVFYNQRRSYKELNPKFCEDIPTLAIEVRSPNDRTNKITRRISQFLGWGVALVWLIDPEDQTVAIHRRDQLPRVLEAEEELTGDEYLPDFRCRVADFFFMPEDANGSATPT